MIEQFHFLRPWWLVAFLPLLGLLWHLYQTRRLSKSWQRVVDTELLPHLLAGRTEIRRQWWLSGVALVGFLAILALAGPTWEKLAQPIFKQKSALVVALDLSHSMDASDIKPNRLTRARLKIADILAQRREGQTALIVYAAQAFSVTPLTDDSETINTLLPSLSTDMMPAQGSRADAALELAYTLFHNAGVTHGDILIVSDGFNPVEATAMEALLAQKSEFRVSVLGIGSTAGGPVPLREGGFLKNAGGSIVIVRLEQEAMRSVAQQTGGAYRQISTDDTDINALLKLMQVNPFEREAVASDQHADIWREQGPWLLLLLLPIVALGFRRGVLLILPLVLIPVAPDAQALEWDALWQNSNQRASQQFERGDHARAAELFDQPEWKASSLFRNKDYDQALQYWQNLDTESAHYNQGNTLAKLGRLEEALKAYEQTLKINPQHEDARYNKQQVEEALKQQQQQEDQKQDNQGQENQSEEQNQQQNDDAQQSGESAQDQANQDASQNSGSDAQDQAMQNQSPESDRPEQSQAQQEQAEAEDPLKSSAEEQADAQAAEPEAVSSLEQQLSEQAAEQWLRKIPDDPGGLLRRKFRYQYQNRGDSTTESNPW